MHSDCEERSTLWSSRLLHRSLAVMRPRTLCQPYGRGCPCRVASVRQMVISARARRGCYEAKNRRRMVEPGGGLGWQVEKPLLGDPVNAIARFVLRGLDRDA